jgi:hypothetical protein
MGLEDCALSSARETLLHAGIRGAAHSCLPRLNATLERSGGPKWARGNPRLPCVDSQSRHCECVPAAPGIAQCLPPAAPILPNFWQPHGPNYNLPFFHMHGYHGIRLTQDPNPMRKLHSERLPHPKPIARSPPWLSLAACILSR